MTVDPLQYARRWKTLAVLSLSLVIIGLDNTILNVALPTLQDEFDASPSKLQWMVDSYLLVFAGLLLVFGTLGDRFGRKLALQAGVSIFGLASLGALVADSANEVITVRAAMGVGAALIMPATLSIIANLFTGTERGKAIAIWAALAAVGIGLGPLAGGLLLEWFGWASVFLVNVPFAAAALLLGIRYVPESRDPRPGSFDVLGAALSTAGFSVLVYSIIEAPEQGWLSGATLGSLTASVALLGAFLWWERRTAEPMLDLGFFRSARFSVGTAAVSVAFFALLGAIFALTQYLQFAHGYSAIEAGAIMSPIALGLMMGAGSSSKAVRRLGISRVVAAGLSGLADAARADDVLRADDERARAGRLVLRPGPVDGLGHGAGHRGGRRGGGAGQVGRRLGHQHRRAHGFRSSRSGGHRVARQLPLLERRRRLARRPAAGGAGGRRGLDRRRKCGRGATATGHRFGRPRDDRRGLHPGDGRSGSWSAPCSPPWRQSSSSVSCRRASPDPSWTRPRPPCAWSPKPTEPPRDTRKEMSEMTPRIEDYALLGDTHTAALVSNQGSIDWLCFPRFDSAATFAALVGDEENGRWQIAPDGQITASRRRYRGDTLVLETDFETPEGSIRLVDFMPARGETAEVVRLVEGVRGRVRVQMELKARFDYGRIRPVIRRIDGADVAFAGPDSVWLHTPVETRDEEGVLRAEFSVTAGELVPFVLTWRPSHEPAPHPVDPMRALADTESYWNEWVYACTYSGEWPEAVVRSLITLKALTYAPTGGIVAAPTTSLPEQLGGVRNWDYRYCWLRDAAFTLLALTRAGYRDEAEAWNRWLVRTVAGDPTDVQIMYGVAGERRLTEVELPWLSGYQGAKPVRIGNEATEQLQLDVYGQVVNSIHHARRAGLEDNGDGWALTRSLVDVVEASWRLPDEGIWEGRGARRHFVNSKVMCWVAVDRALRDAEEFGLPAPVARWRTLRDEISREVLDGGVRRGSRHVHAVLRLHRARRLRPSDAARGLSSTDRRAHARHGRGDRA